MADLVTRLREAYSKQRIQRRLRSDGTSTNLPDWAATCWQGIDAIEKTITSTDGKAAAVFLSRKQTREAIITLDKQQDKSQDEVKELKSLREQLRKPTITHELKEGSDTKLTLKDVMRPSESAPLNVHYQYPAGMSKDAFLSLHKRLIALVTTACRESKTEEDPETILASILCVREMLDDPTGLERADQLVGLAFNLPPEFSVTVMVTLSTSLVRLEESHMKDMTPVVAKILRGIRSRDVKRAEDVNASIDSLQQDLGKALPFSSELIDNWISVMTEGLSAQQAALYRQAILSVGVKS